MILNDNVIVQPRTENCPLVSPGTIKTTQYNTALIPFGLKNELKNNNRYD